MTTSDQAPGHAGPVPYTETTEDTYSQTAAQSFTVTEVDKGTLMLRGPCPRCRDVIDIPVVSGIFKSARSFGRLPWGRGQKPGEAASYTEPMMCNCQNDHPNRPDARSGCGAYWVLTISPPAP